jgi:hypothetical protein
MMVMAALREKADIKESELLELRAQMEQERNDFEQAKRTLIESYEKKLNGTY